MQYNYILELKLKWRKKMSDENESEIPEGLQQMFDVLSGKGFELGVFKPHFEYNPVLDMLSYIARDCQCYEYAVVDTSMMIVREVGTDKIVGFRVGSYSEHEHHQFCGSPN